MTPSPAGTSTAWTSPSRCTGSAAAGPCRGCQVALQPGMSLTERTTRAPERENTVAAAGSAGAPPMPLTHAPAAERPASAWMLSAGRASWLAKTANEPSKPAKVQCGGARTSAS
jgi:hypothetical protein